VENSDLYFIIGQLYVELFVAKNEIQKRDKQIEKLELLNEVERAEDVTES